MKKTALVILIATGLCCAPSLFAQHGHSMAGTHGISGSAGTHGMSGSARTHAGKSAQPPSPSKTPSDMLANKPKLSSKLQSLLPSGMTAQDACSGFKNLGQCVAAVHVSHNLGLSFTDLKSKMLGDNSTTTTTKPLSLGKAIQSLAPTADAKAEVRKAKQQSDDDLKS